MIIYTIGFTRKTAEEFFKILEDNKIEQIVDVRLNNTSQLAAFTKKRDLEFFLKKIAGIDYYHFEFLAPTKELRKKVKDWDAYSKEYLELLEKRKVLEKLDKNFFKKRTCFLCSEPSAEDCHRGILADYLKHNWGIKVVHL
ncbi:MAG: DUF488 domain-containing protein [Methanobacterium sp.]|nr:DUF488 domain-containing protein [Methanobacterium sp.]